MPTRNRVIEVLAMLLSVCVLGYGFSAYMDSVTVHNTGVSTTAPELSVNVSSIDWGTLNPTETAVRTVQLSTTKPISYAINYENQQPSNLWDYVSIVSNATGTLNDVTHITFELTISPSAPELSFSFDIIISGV